MAKSIRFKVGMQVKINAENTGVAPLYRTIAQMGFSNGDTVKLVDYDPADETWFVQSINKIEVRGWIKRKNLAPIEVKAEPQPQLNPFKVGDKVELTNKDAEWASNDDVTTGVEYTVKQVHEPATGQKVPYIKVSGDKASGVFWIECKYFKKAEPKVKAVDLTDTRGWKEGDILSKDILNDGTYRDFYGFTSYGKKWVSMQCKGFYGSDARTIEKIKVLRGRLAAKISECSANIWIAIDTLPVKEEPKPVVAETPKKRMAVCVNMDGSFETSYMVGKVYEIYEETDDYYYLAEVDGKRYEGGMFKWRFKEIDKQEPATVDKTFTVSIAKDKLVAFDKELQALVAKYK